MIFHIKELNIKGPRLKCIWDLEKTVLHEIRVSGTVLSYIIAKKRGSFGVNGGPPVLFLIVSNYFSLN